MFTGSNETAQPISCVQYSGVRLRMQYKRRFYSTRFPDTAIRLESALLLRLPHATVTGFALYCYPAWQEERPLAHKTCLAVGEAT